jgi:hypothetical protein
MRIGDTNEKVARQLGDLFFSRENSSNGGKAVKTFRTKSYESKKGGVKQYLGNKCLYFQQLKQQSNTLVCRSNLRQQPPETPLTRYS